MKTVEEQDILLALEPRLESAALARHALEDARMRGDVEHAVLLLTTEWSPTRSGTPVCGPTTG
jgi:hypothetical protein